MSKSKCTVRKKSGYYLASVLTEDDYWTIEITGSTPVEATQALVDELEREIEMFQGAHCQAMAKLAKLLAKGEPDDGVEKR